VWQNAAGKKQRLMDKEITQLQQLEAQFWCTRFTVPSKDHAHESAAPHHKANYAAAVCQQAARAWHSSTVY